MADDKSLFLVSVHDGKNFDLFGLAKEDPMNFKIARESDESLEKVRAMYKEPLENKEAILMWLTEDGETELNHAEEVCSLEEVNTDLILTPCDKCDGWA